MSRTPLRRCVTAVVILTAALAPLKDVKGDDKNKPRTEAHLYVNEALWEGREHVRRGDYAKAVEILEIGRAHV